ncbi:MAG TPA: hypothetical protein VN048_02620 [Verrucomicrobiae bacterium]|nr:hypothetical protein [Verrucomicrobiae bacterium]
MRLLEMPHVSGILRQPARLGLVIRDIRKGKQGGFQLALPMLKNEITSPVHAIVLPSRRADVEWEDASFPFAIERNINH